MSATRMLAMAGFLLAAVAVVAVEWAARRGAAKVPRLGDALAVVMQYDTGGIPVGRLAILGFWFWLGWHFLAR